MQLRVGMLFYKANYWTARDQKNKTLNLKITCIEQHAAVYTSKVSRLPLRVSFRFGFGRNVRKLPVWVCVFCQGCPRSLSQQYRGRFFNISKPFKLSHWYPSEWSTRDLSMMIWCVCFLILKYASINYIIVLLRAHWHLYFKLQVRVASWLHGLQTVRSNNERKI